MAFPFIAKIGAVSPFFDRLAEFPLSLVIFLFQGESGKKISGATIKAFAITAAPEGGIYRFLSSFRLILPLMVLGSSSTNSTIRGYL